MQGSRPLLTPKAIIGSTSGNCAAPAAAVAAASAGQQPNRPAPAAECTLAPSFTVCCLHGQLHAPGRGRQGHSRWQDTHGQGSTETSCTQREVSQPATQSGACWGSGGLAQERKSWGSTLIRWYAWDRSQATLGSAAGQGHDTGVGVAGMRMTGECDTRGRSTGWVDGWMGEAHWGIGMAKRQGHGLAAGRQRKQRGP